MIDRNIGQCVFAKVTMATLTKCKFTVHTVHSSFPISIQFPDSISDHTTVVL